MVGVDKIKSKRAEVAMVDGTVLLERFLSEEIFCEHVCMRLAGGYYGLEPFLFTFREECSRRVRLSHHE